MGRLVASITAFLGRGSRKGFGLQGVEGFVLLRLSCFEVCGFGLGKTAVFREATSFSPGRYTSPSSVFEEDDLGFGFRLLEYRQTLGFGEVGVFEVSRRAQGSDLGQVLSVRTVQIPGAMNPNTSISDI